MKESVHNFIKRIFAKMEPIHNLNKSGMKHQWNMLHQIYTTSKLYNNDIHPLKHEGLQSPDESSTSGQLQRQPVSSSVHLCLHLKIQSCMRLEHTCTKYGYMQAHTKDMHEKGQLFPNNMIMESQVSGLAKLGLGKSVSFPKLDQESQQAFQIWIQVIHDMRVTCIIILIILDTAQNILHIAHIILHIAHNILHIAQIICHETLE